jgi:8-oxo-dGTP pyrophosphatase MutT (NUDIX family)
VTSTSFRVTAKALIFIDNRILLIRKPEGVWDLPGGRLEAGEHPERALKREIEEELGISAAVGEIADCSLRRRASGQMDVFVVSYHCRTKAGLKDIRLSHEHTEAKLFGVSAVPSLTMHDTYKAAVQRGSRHLKPKAKPDLHPTALEAWSFLIKSGTFQTS